MQIYPLTHIFKYNNEVLYPISSKSEKHYMHIGNHNLFYRYYWLYLLFKYSRNYLMIQLHFL